MVMKFDLHSLMEKPRTNGFLDDFNSYTDAQVWTKGATSVGGEGLTCGDNDGGQVILTTGGTANNEQFFATTNKIFKFQANKAIGVQCEVNYTDSDTNNLAFAFGLYSGTILATLMADTTFALPASFSGCLIYKKPGENSWRCASSVGTTQQLSLSTLSSIQAGVNQRLTIFVQPVGSNVEITFQAGIQGLGGANQYAGQLTGSTAQNPLLLNLGTDTAPVQSVVPKEIKHVIAYSGAAAMKLVHFAKAGTAHSQTPAIDYSGWEYLARP